MFDLWKYVKEFCPEGCRCVRWRARGSIFKCWAGGITVNGWVYHRLLYCIVMPNAARPDGALLVHQVHPPLPQGSPSYVHQPPPSPCHLSRSQITHILPLHISHNCLCQPSHCLFLPSIILMVLVRMRLVMMMMTRMVRKTKQAGCLLLPPIPNSQRTPRTLHFKAPAHTFYNHTLFYRGLLPSIVDIVSFPVWGIVGLPVHQSLWHCVARQDRQTVHLSVSHWGWLDFPVIYSEPARDRTKIVNSPATCPSTWLWQGLC